MKRLGIIIVTYNSERHVGPLLASLAATIDPAQTEIWILDNASPDGTLAALERELAASTLPVHLIRSAENLGFMRANNRVLAELQEKTPCETVVLLNPDTRVHPGWWEPLVEMLKDPDVGTVAPLLLLPDGTVNSRGNAVHFLGLGFVQGYGEPVDAVPEKPALFFGSGAALAFSATVLESVNLRLGTTGIFWEELFLYADDTDLGWRMRLVGLDNRLCPTARVTHDHRFWLANSDVSGNRMFQIERNRYLLVFANFKRPTILILAPWIIASEIALALRLWELYPHRLKLWRAIHQEVDSPAFQERRRKIQAGRIVSDHVILKVMTGSIRHGAMPFRFIDRIFDALSRASHGLICFLVRW
jgi:GT2 family glycosyltransferase